MHNLFPVRKRSPGSFSMNLFGTTKACFPSKISPCSLLKYPPQMPWDAFFLNLSFLGGCHIIAFGVPVLLGNQDGPATIRNSSLFFSVGSKNMASSPTLQGKKYSILLDC
jgi:hypothetical protein